MTLDRAILDGTPLSLTQARLAITDDGASRGDGAFESIGVWGGRPFRLRDHLERLNRSLAGIVVPQTDLDAIAADAEALLADVHGDAMLRVYVTSAGTRLVYVTSPPQRPAPERLVPAPAPWIRPLGTYGPAGAKTMSYAPNMAAGRAAQAAGGDDALLYSLEGWVLEGPTFAVLWVADTRLYAAPLELGIVDSISRRTLIDIADSEGIRTIVEPRPLDHLLAADEVMVCSAVRELVAVRQVGDRSYEPVTPVRDVLAARLSERRNAPT